MDPNILFPARNRAIPPVPPSRQPSSKKNQTLSENEKTKISSQMKIAYHNGKLKKGTLKQIAEEYGVSRWTTQRLWKVVHKSIIDGSDLNLKPKFKGRNKSVFIDLEQVRQLDLKKRQCLATLSHSLGCSTSTVQRIVCKGKIRVHRNAIKPFLTEHNMRHRMKFILSKIQTTSIPRNPVFDCMFKYVHIDEKWFYMTRVTQKYYLLPDEPNPHRTCNSKKYIQKVMFMAATARPRYASDGTCTFNGKIGIFSFTVLVPAQRGSKNRVKGTLETKPIPSITKSVIKECLIEKVIPAIKQRWPHEADKHIIIQQDNVRPHIKIDDPEFTKAAQSDGFNIVLECQPPNSPDLNILDLGFFRVIQTIQHEKTPKTVIELVEAVETAYEESKDITLNYVWLSLMYCMNEILKDNGNNRYKIPHMNKRKLQRLGELPTHVSPDREVVLQRMEELGIEIPQDNAQCIANGNAEVDAQGDGTQHIGSIFAHDQEDTTQNPDLNDSLYDEWGWDSEDQGDEENDLHDSELWDETELLEEEEGYATDMGYTSE